MPGDGRNSAAMIRAGLDSVMLQSKMTFRLLVSQRRNLPAMLTQCFQVRRCIGGLLLVQAKVGHIGFRLHRRGRLNPMNKILRNVLKFAGNVGAARHLIQRRADHSVRSVDSGNHVAGTAAELLHDHLSALRRAGDLRRSSMEFLSSQTSAEHSASSENQGRRDHASAHIRIRCGGEREMFSPKSPPAAEFAIFCCARDAHEHGIRPKLAGFRRFLSVRLPAVGVLLLAAFVPGRAGCCQTEVSAPPPDGKQIFAQYCAKCHGERGQGVSAAMTFAGPSLQAEHNPGNVMTALEVGPEHMPRFEYVLSGDQMRAVSQYVVQKLAVIPLNGGNVSEGGELYRSHCASCHRTDVRGGALGYVGTNAPPLVDKSPALIAGAIRWGPGPMPPFPPSVLSDQQVASIVDYIQTVKHPPNPGGNPLRWYGPTSEGFAAWVMVLIVILFTIWAEWGGKG